jgi:hypothetical protein
MNRWNVRSLLQHRNIDVVLWLVRESKQWCSLNLQWMSEGWLVPARGGLRVNGRMVVVVVRLVSLS